MEDNKLKDIPNKLPRYDVMKNFHMVVRGNFCISFYAPIKKKGQVLDAAFLYRAASSAATTLRARPFSKIVIEPKKQILVEYQDARIYDFMDEGAYPMSKELDYAVPAKTAAEQLELTRRVNELYKEIRTLPWKEDRLSEEELRMVTEYADCFYKAVPESLLPFYKALSPEFFAWLTEKR